MDVRNEHYFQQHSSRCARTLEACRSAPGWGWGCARCVCRLPMRLPCVGAGRRTGGATKVCNAKVGCRLHDYVACALSGLRSPRSDLCGFGCAWLSESPFAPHFPLPPPGTSQIRQCMGALQLFAAVIARDVVWHPPTVTLRPRAIPAWVASSAARASSAGRRATAPPPRRADASPSYSARNRPPTPSPSRR